MKYLYKLTYLFIAMLLSVSMGNAQDLVASYSFSGNAVDESGNNLPTLVNGALLTSDRFGEARNAYQFDGVLNFIQGENKAHLQSTATTVSFWVQVNSLPAQGEVYLMSHGGWQERWKISLPSHGKPVWTTNHANGISDMDSGDGNELVAGEWTHLTFVHDGAKDIIYFNGAQVAEKDVAGDLNSTSHPLGMGFDPINVANFFDGDLDEVMIWNGALSAGDIANLYAVQSADPSYPRGVVANYSFDGNMKDGSVYGNTATSMDASLRTDRFGFGSSAADFNGVSSGVNAPNSSQLNSDSTTVVFWVKVNELPPTGEYYLASFGGWQERWKISLPSHGKPVWTTNHENGISDMDSGDGNELVPGEWMHLAFVHDGAKDYIYLNGNKAAEKEVIGLMNSTTHPLGIGYNPIDNGNFFDGSIDEFAIYNYALDGADIMSLYTDQSMGDFDPSDPVVLNLPFTGNTVDASQFGNDAHGFDLTSVQDRFGLGANAVSFNGTSSFAYSPNSVQYNSDYASVSFWVNMTELPATGEVFLLSNGGWQERWKISLPSHGKPVWTTNHETGISDMDSGDGNELKVGEWTHVVMIHGAAKDMIYMNGVLANEKDVGGKLNSTNYPFGIGYNPIDGGAFMNGMMDDIMLFNSELTAQEVADLYNAQNTPPVIDGGIVADYAFYNNTNDLTRFSNNAANMGALPSKDRFGRSNNAYSFNGTTDYMAADNSVQLNSPLASISFWINVNELPVNGEAYLISFGGWQERFKISLPTHGKPVFTTNHENGISDMDSGDGNELVPGNWTHVVMVHDGAKDLIYFDGNMVAEKDVVGNLNNTTYPLGFGYNIVDGGSYFNGALDEIQLYNIALTDGEVMFLYEQQLAEPMHPDTIPPYAPVNLRGYAEFTDVFLSWEASEDGETGVIGYNVYVDSVLTSSTPTPGTMISGLDPTTLYNFGVTAIDSAGNQSMMATTQVTTGMDAAPDTIPPTAPSNLVIDAGANSALFSWDASEDENGVSGYIVYVDGELIDTVAGTETSIFIGGLESETLYTFEVEAFDPSGNVSDLADITESTGPPVDAGEDGLVAHYPFEGNADDATPYENHGVIGGNPTFEDVENRPNASGQAIVFDGDMDSVLAPNAVQLISDYATVSFWIRVDDINLQDAEAYIIDFGHWDERWKISLPQHTKIVWTTNSKNMISDNFISDMDSGDGNELIEGFWWYVTMVHDGTDDIVYVDGKEANRKPAGGTLNSTGRPLGFGSNPIDGGQYFNGALDEVKIYNRALTAVEIEKLYNTGTTAVPYIQDELFNLVDMVYPNPTSAELVVKHSFEAGSDVKVRVFDASGRQVAHLPVDEVSGQHLKLNVAELQSGMYSLNFVLDGRNIGSIPFVKE